VCIHSGMYLALLLPHSMTGSPVSRMPQPSLKSAPVGRSARSTRPRGTAVASCAGSDAPLLSFWRRRWLRSRLGLEITDLRNCAFDWEIVGLSVGCYWVGQSNKKSPGHRHLLLSRVAARSSMLHPKNLSKSRS
jgi:hypothetical protein